MQGPVPKFLYVVGFKVLTSESDENANLRTKRAIFLQFFGKFLLRNDGLGHHDGGFPPKYTP